MKRTVWILLAAIAVVAGVYLAADLLGNGMLREFLSEQFFYMEEYTDTTGILHQYLSPNWYRIKQLLFLLTALVVVICIVCVRTQSSRVAMKHRAEIEKAMETALHQFLEDRDFYLPRTEQPRCAHFHQRLSVSGNLDSEKECAVYLSGAVVRPCGLFKGGGRLLPS